MNARSWQGRATNFLLSWPLSISIKSVTFFAYSILMQISASGTPASVSTLPRFGYTETGTPPEVSVWGGWPFETFCLREWLYHGWHLSIHLVACLSPQLPPARGIVNVYCFDGCSPRPSYFTFSPLALLMALRGLRTRSTRKIFTTLIALDLGEKQGGWSVPIQQKMACADAVLTGLRWTMDEWMDEWADRWTDR